LCRNTASSGFPHSAFIHSKMQNGSTAQLPTSLHQDSIPINLTLKSEKFMRRVTRALEKKPHSLRFLVCFTNAVSSRVIPALQNPLCRIKENIIDSLVFACTRLVEWRSARLAHVCAFTLKRSWCVGLSFTAVYLLGLAGGGVMSMWDSERRDDGRVLRNDVVAEMRCCRRSSDSCATK
jgi:hypothetical protein